MVVNVRALVVVMSMCLMVAPPSYGQDTTAQPSAETAKTLPLHGSFDVGYRFRSLDGSHDAFRQLFDLDEGLRLLGVDLHGEAGDEASPFADRFAITASGLGGDPFPTLQVSMSKARRYRVRVNWRRSRFFDVAPQTPDSIAGFDKQAVTDRHSWTTARQIGNAAWTFDATNRLHFLFNYDHVSNEGTLQTTRSLDYVGASAVWGAFARANSYELFGPVDNTANRVAGGVSYGRDRWTINYRAGRHVLDDAQTFDPLATPERSINVTDPVTAREPLSMLGWSQSRHLTAPTSELSFVARPASAVEWRGEYLFYRYRGPFSLDAAYQGTARTNNGGTAFSPYDVTVTARGSASTPNHVVEQGLTWRPGNLWALDVAYRYSRSETDARAQLGSVVARYPVAAAAPTSTTEDVSTTWRSTLHSVVIASTWSPTPALTVRPGFRVSRRDVDARQDGIVEPGASRRERAIWPEINVGYRPDPRFNARGTYQTSYSDSSYTRMSPVQRSIGRIVVHVEPLPAFSVEASANRTDSELLDAGFVSHMRTGSVTLAYALSDRFSMTGGLDYQSFLGTGNVTFLRGTPPITEVPMRDREIDRVWQAGIIIRPTSRLGVTTTANFDRTAGVDIITDEPPLYGPLSFTYATGSVYYDIPRAGRVAVDLQRTYLIQELLPLNNFRANLLTLRFSRTF